MFFLLDLIHKFCMHKGNQELLYPSVKEVNKKVEDQWTKAFLSVSSELFSIKSDIFLIKCKTCPAYARGHSSWNYS